jgi:hypothetical protein
MRCEAEVYERLSAGEVELKRLSREVARLSIEVRLGGEGWREALEALSTDVRRQRTLEAQLEGLRWVLTGEVAQLAG